MSKSLKLSIAHWECKVFIKRDKILNLFIQDSFFSSRVEERIRWLICFLSSLLEVFMLTIAVILSLLLLKAGLTLVGCFLAVDLYTYLNSNKGVTPGLQQRRVNSHYNWNYTWCQ